MKFILMIALLVSSGAYAQDSSSLKSNANVLKVCKFAPNQTPVFAFGKVLPNESTANRTIPVGFFCTKGVNPVFKLKAKSINEGFGFEATSTTLYPNLLLADKTSKLKYVVNIQVTSSSTGYTGKGNVNIFAGFGAETQAGVKPGLYSDELYLTLTP